MKIRERALAILLSMVMMLAFMPAMAFAEGEEPDADGTPVAEEIVATEEAVETPDVDSEAVTEAPEADLPEAAEPKMTVQDVDEDWGICKGYDEWLDPGYDTSLYAWVSPYSETVNLEYQWKKNGTVIVDWTALEDVDEDGDLYNEIYDVTAGSYTFLVREVDDNSQTASAVFGVYDNPVNGGLIYRFDSDNASNAWVEELNSDISGNLVVLPTVAFPDGVTRTVTEVYVASPKASSINIPASVTHIWEGVGRQSDSSDAAPIPGFTIFGTNGTAAQAHANKYGIPFRDLAAEAEAARQGTPDGSLPKVKIAKPKAAKKAATVKWKKLNKKQLKKSKAQKIEVWVCPNGGFGANDTIMKTTGKKKASLKVKGLKKGTYFVKVRAIKYVGGTKMVGPWSKVKKVKIKK